MKAKILKWCVALLLIVSNISCDQITKEKVRTEISQHEIIPIIDHHFILKKVENKGAALSMGEHLNPILKVVLLQVTPLIVLMLLCFYIFKESKISHLNLIGLSFIIGGGIGNIYDRIVYGSVTDFMYVEFGLLKTGIFNMADVSVSIGAILVLLGSFKKKSQQTL